VNTKIQVLDAIVAAMNQKMTGTPPFITLVATSILSEQYRFIEFFVPGIIAMAIMTSALGNALSMNAELRQKGILRKLGDDADHAHRLACLEHPVPAHSLHRFDGRDPPRQLRRLRRPVAHRRTAPAHRRDRSHRFRRHRHAAHPSRKRRKARRRSAILPCFR
jgi:hypothetical protein